MPSTPLTGRSGGKVVLESFFLNTAGLATALILVPFLLFYLIRPKPHKERIPSLLFIMQDAGKSNINSFFRTLLKDLLFLFHLFLLLLLIAAAAQPYVKLPQKFLADQTVIVIDVSASMHAGDRFDQAIELAEKNVGRQNTIIRVTSNPDVLVERVSPGRAKEALKLLEPAETTTSISDALQLATSYAGTGSQVIVISDFIATAGDRDYDTYADLLEAQGALVTYLPVAGGQENVGIIDLMVGPITSTLWVKNYNDRPEEAKVKISDAEQTVLLGPGESKEVTFNTPAGVAEIRLIDKDDLEADDTVWTSAPEKNNIKLLVITNDKGNFQRSNFKVALDVISQNFPTTFDISYAEPPKIPDLNHDVYLVYNARLDFILPGYIRDIYDGVTDGASLIILEQSNPFGLDWQGLLPITAPENSEMQGRATITSTAESTLTQDIEFGQVTRYLPVEAEPATTTLAKAGDKPVIILARRGKGHVLYYGIDDAAATFPKNPSYPVFWRRAFDQLTNRPSLENLNLRTGSLLSLSREMKIKTPTSTLTTNLLPLDNAGLYVLPDRTIAANLLSDAESGINAERAEEASERVESEAGEEKLPKELTNIALWAALILLLLEMAYVKYRGDF